jgi:hypothetical protein
MKVSAEVAVFEGEVGRDENLVTGWGPQNSAVVADAESNGGMNVCPCGEGTANLIDQCEFSDRLRGTRGHAGSINGYGR